MKRIDLNTKISIILIIMSEENPSIKSYYSNLFFKDIKEKDFLLELSCVINEKIPKLEEFKNESFGFTLENGQIIGLSLYNKGIESIPKSIENLRSLRYLSLSHCKKLTYLHYIRYLSNLEILDISYCNSLQSIAYLWELPKLKIIDISCGNISYLHSFNEFPELELIKLIDIPTYNEKDLKYLQNHVLIIIDRLSMTPGEIYKAFKNRKTAKIEAANQLISVIENSNSNYYRIQGLEYFGKIGYESEGFTKIIENSLISDESSLVRSAAAKTMSSNLSLFGIKSLKWTIFNENSTECLYTIYKSLNNQNNNDSKELIKLMENRFIDEEKLKLNLNQEEIIGLGLLELEIMKAKIFKSFKDRIDYEFHLDGHMPPLCVIVQEGCIRGIEIISESFNPIKVFELFPRLNFLSLLNTKIKEIKNFESLINLKKLDLSGNGIYVIKGLDKLVNLRKLNLSYNNISEIKGLDNLVNLEKLNLEDNKITKITGLKKIKKLKKLNLQFNYIEDVDTTNIPNLDEIYIFPCDFLYESMKENIKYDYSMDTREIDENYKEKCEKCIKKLKNLDFLLYVGYWGDRPSFKRIIIEKAVRKYPESVKWLSKLLEELVKSNEYIRAKNVCERILKIDPNEVNNENVKKVISRFTNPKVIEIVDDEEFNKF